MTFIQIYLQALFIILALMSALWIASVLLKNASIADLFWGFGFVAVSSFYFLKSEGNDLRKILVMSLVAFWGLRLSLYLTWRNEVLGSVLMTLLIIKVSGVVLLEKSLREQKPEYKNYIEKTSSFFPWFPEKK